MQQKPQLVWEGLGGYISMEVPAPPEEFGYGVSLYANAWPLVEKPLRDFQIGLASIWIVPENRKISESLLPTGTVARDNWPERGPSYRDVFQTIEGGLGFWGSTRFGSPTAKFRMNGTANGYNHEIASPGWGFGKLTALKPDEMGIAQLSPRILVPPDGMTFKEGRTILLHNLTHYSKDALYHQVEHWLAGEATAPSRFDDKASNTPACKARPLGLRQGSEKLPMEGVESWVATKAFDKSTFGLQWNDSVLEPWTKKMRRGSFPEYTKKEGKSLTAITVSVVPDETGLKAAQFAPARTGQVYASPETSESVWKKPGPKAGPFEAKLADGSVVTYYWYRFIDQPSLQDADLSDAEKQRLQAVVEKIHTEWTTKKEYLPPPSTGTLATLDPALLVKPPRGLSRGYVPIAVHQAAPQ